MKNKKKFSYNIIKDDDEIYLYYNIRKIFINNLNPKNKKEFKLFEMYSHILINILFLKCRYSKNTEEKIKYFIKDYKNNIKDFINISQYNNYL
jgi:hypothetical protein